MVSIKEKMLMDENVQHKKTDQKQKQMVKLQSRLSN